MASHTFLGADDELEREQSLRTRISNLEKQVKTQAAELESTYALLGRERADRLRTEQALSQEHRLTEALFAHSPIGIQLFDRDGVSLRMNEAQRKLLGLPSLSYGVGEFNVLTDPFQVAAGIADAFSRAYAGEVVHLIGQRADLSASLNTWSTSRQPIYYNQYIFPIYDGWGAVEAVVSFDEDITPTYEARQALNTATQMIEGLFEHAPMALQIYDRDGFSFRMNEMNRQLLGVPSREYGVGEFNALTDPFMVANGHAALFARAYAGEVVRVSLHSANFDDPSNTWDTGRYSTEFQQIIFPILDEDGSVSAVVSCVVGVSPSAPGEAGADPGS